MRIAQQSESSEHKTLRSQDRERVARGVMHTLQFKQGMHDTSRDRPDHECLFDVASEQLGYFTAAQARDCGFGWDRLTRHVQSGRYLRLQRGRYRLRDYPSTPHEEIVAAWLAVGKDSAVVSHETALDLLDLGDVSPHFLHITVPRERRYRSGMPGVDVHTTTRPVRPEDIITREGIRLTSPTRTILDSAEIGTGPEQIDMAVRQAVDRGPVDPRQLRERSRERGGRVARLIESSLEAART